MKVVNANRGTYAEDGSIGIVCRGSNEIMSEVFLIRGPYWKEDSDLLVKEANSRRNAVHLPTRCLEKADVKLTQYERENLMVWWSSHGFNPEKLA